ncbi:Protein yellow, partial [Gryllus bimaculatus]
NDILQKNGISTLANIFVIGNENTTLDFIERIKIAMSSSPPPPLLLPLFLSLLLALGAAPASALTRLQELYTWRGVDFQFPNAAVRAAAIRSGAYVEGSAVPLDVDVYQGESGQRVFVTLPRLNPGTPTTLATVVEDPRAGAAYVPGGSPGSAPLLTAYPDWAWNRQGDCDALTSVFRMQVDQACGRLWALDTGRVDILSRFELICPPKLVVFDLRGGDRVLKKHRFPDDVLQAGSLPVTVAVDVRGADRHSCGSAFAYVADVTEYGLVVYDLYNDRSWRVNHKYFYPYPTSGTFNVAGTTFDLMDGVLGLALSPALPQEGGERRLYFHSLASVRESWVSTGVLRNASLFADGANAARGLFRLSEGERPSQAAAEAMDPHGVLFFSLLARNSLNCWVAATGSPYNARSLVELDQDDRALQFASGLKVVTGRDGAPEVWLLTSRFQRLMGSGLDPTDFNFRVLRAPVRLLVKGTKCDQRRGGVEAPQRPSYGQGHRPDLRASQKNILKTISNHTNI